jgi:acyl-coenzyme A thioesterase 9
MEDAKVKNIIVCHPEQRNIYNKIFGGFLMRQGFELGWVNACMFSGSLVDISVVDDITFRRPVIIGSLLFLSSQVVYTQGNSILVKVYAEAVEPLTKNRYVTNEFYFKFTASTKTTVPRVIPKSYSEAMIYLDGKRHW